MSEKCSYHKDRRRRIYGRIFSGVLITLFICLVVFLIIWAVLQPKKPRLVLRDVTIFALNATTPNVVTTNIQVTIYAHNPNDKIGIYYDKLDAYVTYRNQQITLFYTINPSYQGHKETDIWSPFLSGANVPVAPYNGLRLGQDLSYGQVNLEIKLYGPVRFKVGTFISGRYRLFVKCPATIIVGSQSTGLMGGNGIKYQMSQDCSVSV